MEHKPTLGNHKIGAAEIPYRETFETLTTSYLFLPRSSLVVLLDQWDHVQYPRTATRSYRHVHSDLDTNILEAADPSAPLCAIAAHSLKTFRYSMELLVYVLYNLRRSAASAELAAYSMLIARSRLPYRRY